MTENGEEKLLAVARHIAQTLGHSDSTADDILKIFSTFDRRFSNSLLNGPDQLEALHRRISHYLSSDRLIWSDPSEAASFLDSIDDLISVVQFSGQRSVNDSLYRSEDLLHQAMFRIEDELRLLMDRSVLEPLENYEEDDKMDPTDQIPIADQLTDYNIVIDLLPSGTINDIQEMAKRMVSSGFEKECCHAYSRCRREFLDESLSRLAIHKYSVEEVRDMPWCDLEEEIERWTKASIVAVRILFPSERRLCDRLFFGMRSACELSFMEVCRGCVVQILNFADAVSIGSRAPERLFKVLDLFETIRELLPELETLFSDQLCVFLRNEAITVWKRSGEAVRGIFMELENLIIRDPAKAPFSDGRLHPITRYVMNYLRAACRSRGALEQIFNENYRKLEDQMGWVMEVLVSNLEAKSKMYRDASLCCIFMMNNEKYIVEKVKDSELGVVLGEDWVRKHSAKVRQYVVSYQRSSWNKGLGLLKTQASLRDKLKLFNQYFEEYCKAQSTWVVFHDEQREELRKYVIGNLLPTYTNFFVSFQAEYGKQSDRSPVRLYSPQEIEGRIRELFTNRTHC